LHRAILDFAPDDIKNQIAEVIRRIRIRIPWSIDWVEAISVDYGQRHRKEAEYAARTCARLDIKHSVLSVRGILDGAGVMLADASVPIPDISYDQIKGVSPTYVPFRNGTLLALITAHAQKWVNAQVIERSNAYQDSGSMKDEADVLATKDMRDCAGVYFGAHAEDAANWAYPDCTPEFIGAMANAIYVGSYGCVRLYTPLEWSDKQAIIEYGTKLGVNWKDTWSCYAGGEAHCGTCPTCRARRAGFIAAGVEDPTVYVRAAAWR